MSATVTKKAMPIHRGAPKFVLHRQGLLSHNGRREAIAVSALTGDGIPALLAGLEQAVTRGNITLTLKLDAADGSALAFAYRHAQVLDRRIRAGKISLSLRVHPDDLGRFQNRFPKKIAIEQGVDARS